MKVYHCYNNISGTTLPYCDGFIFTTTKKTKSLVLRDIYSVMEYCLLGNMPDLLKNMGKVMACMVEMIDIRILL